MDHGIRHDDYELPAALGSDSELQLFTAQMAPTCHAEPCVELRQRTSAEGQVASDGPVRSLQGVVVAKSRQPNGASSRLTSRHSVALSIASSTAAHGRSRQAGAERGSCSGQTSGP